MEHQYFHIDAPKNLLITYTKKRATIDRIIGFSTFASQQSLSSTKAKLLPHNAKNKHIANGIVKITITANNTALHISHILIKASLIIP